MIMFRHTSIADTTVLAPWRLQEMASPTYLAWLIEHMIVWVPLHSFTVVVLCNERSFGGGSFVRK